MSHSSAEARRCKTISDGMLKPFSIRIRYCLETPAFLANSTLVSPACLRLSANAILISSNFYHLYITTVKIILRH